MIEKFLEFYPNNDKFGFIIYYYIRYYTLTLLLHFKSFFKTIRVQEGKDGCLLSLISQGCSIGLYVVEPFRFMAHYSLLRAHSPIHFSIPFCHLTFVLCPSSFALRQRSPKESGAVVSPTT